MVDDERELGRVLGMLDALRIQVAEHDARDQENFKEILSRLRPLETQDAIEDYRRHHIGRVEAQGHTWRQTIVMVITVTVTSILTSLATVWASVK